MQTKKIRIKKETYNRLVKKGKIEDTIDEIINRILDKIDYIDSKKIQSTWMTNTIMNLKSTKKHRWNPPILNS